MAGARVDLKFNAGLVPSALIRAMELLGDPEPLMADIGEYLLTSHRQRFRDQVSPSGQKWAPLKPHYKAQKAKNRDRILTLDGFLGGTLRYSASSSDLLFGTDRRYGAAHHFGFAPRGLPARPWLGTSAEDDLEITAIAQQHIEEAMEGQ